MIHATTIVNSAQSRIAGDPMWSVDLPSRGPKEGCDGSEQTDIANRIWLPGIILRQNSKVNECAPWRVLDNPAILVNVLDLDEIDQRIIAV